MSKPAKTNSSDKLGQLQKQLIVIILTLCLCVIVFQICSYFGDVLRILGISILFSYLFIAVVDKLDRLIKSRVAAVFTVFAIVIIGVVFIASALVPTVVAQISQLINTIYMQLPQMMQSLTRYLLPFEHHLNSAHIKIKTVDLLNNTFTLLPKLEAGELFNRVGDVAMSTISWTVYGLTVLLLSFYFLLDGYKMQAAFIKVLPSRFQNHAQTISTEIDHSLQAFFKGQVVLALGFGTAISLIYYVLGVHYALLLGIILAAWEIIPVIGPTVGFIPTLFSVALDGMDQVPFDRFTQLLVAIAIFAGLQWLKDNIVAPKYMGNVIGLHPVVIFLAMFIGAKIDGWFGIIFALPVACVVQVLIKHLYALYSEAAVSDEPE